MGFKDLSLLQHNDFGQVSRIPQSQLGPTVIASKTEACVGIWALVCGCSEPGGTLRGAALLPDLYTLYSKSLGSESTQLSWRQPRRRLAPRLKSLILSTQLQFSPLQSRNNLVQPCC